MKKRSLQTIKKAIIHCSDSDFGCVDVIDDWHKSRGWGGCGYHYVISNGIFQSEDKYDADRDGIVQAGRDLTYEGAHCRGQNGDTVGICIIGRRHFTGKQLLEGLPDLLWTLGALGITCRDVYGHCEFSKVKTCPNIDPRLLRSLACKMSSCLPYRR